MKLKFKNSFIGFFQFYYGVLGGRLLVYLLLSVCVSLLDGVGLAMFMPLLQSADGHTDSSSESMGFLHHFTDAIVSAGFPMTINTVLVVLVSLFVIKGALKLVQLSFQVNLRHLFMRKVRYALVGNLQGLSYNGFLKLDAGRIQNVMTSEVQRLSQTMNFYFSAAQSAVMLVTYMGMAFLANPQFAIFVGIGAGLSNFLYRNIYQATKKASIGVSEKGSQFNSLLTQAVHNYKYLKSTNYFGKFSQKLIEVINRIEVLNKKMGFYSAITASVKEPMIIVVVSLVMYIQINLMGASIGSILLVLLLFYRALSFLVIVQNFWQSFIQNIGSMHLVSELYAELQGVQEIQQSKQFEGFGSELNIENVVFSYGENRVLDALNVVIPKNHTIALVGESGSGKTTLANMISGLIIPNEGSLYIDGVSLYDYNLNSYRNKIGYISQEAVIFNDNIFNNITFWAEPTEENKKRFWDIIALASLNDFIANQPNHELTELGDNGILISGGQKQRISIARELYKKVEILILDEATSALDSETERVIQENIEKLHGSYTMIIIAHRLSTIKEADTIYLLEKGRVTASGNFSQMIERSARFKRMISLQEV